MTKNSIEYTLFVKQNTLSEEDNLITYMATHFGMGDDLIPFLEWEPESRRTIIYLWIRNAAREAVSEKFGFVLPENAP